MKYKDVRPEFRHLNFYQIVPISSSIDNLFAEDRVYHYLSEDEKIVLRKIRLEIATKVFHDNGLF